MDLQQVTSLDVSELEPPQPMQLITAALQKLAIGEVVSVKHRRIPFPLFDMLAGRFDYFCDEITSSHYQIYFWQLKDSKAKALAEHLSLNSRSKDQRDLEKLDLEKLALEKLSNHKSSSEHDK